jgi:hypothetical protein
MKRNKNRAAINQSTATGTMKTKMLHIAAALSAAALLGPVALAGQKNPIKWQTSGPVNRADCCVMQASCKDTACCSTKMKSNSPALGGRASHSSLKKVRICTSSCTVATPERASICRVGSRK